MAGKLKNWVLFFGMALPWAGISQTSTGIKILNEEAGLSQNFVYDILQDRKGFLWISTGAGLSRYDGRETKNFYQRDGLSNDFITSSKITKNGLMVLGHYQGSISLYNGVSFKKIFGDSLNSEIISLEEDKQGNLWCFSKSKGIIKLNSDLTDPEIYFPAELYGKIIYQAKIVGSRVWVATNEGFYLFQVVSQKLLFIDSAEELLTTEVTAIESRDSDSSRCWVGTADGNIYALKMGNSVQIESTSSFPYLSGQRISSILIEKNDKLWVATSSKGLYQFTTLGASRLVLKGDFANHLELQSISKLIVDSSGALWAATLGQGCIKLFSKNFHYFDFGKWNVNQVVGVAETPYGYFVATDVGLLKFYTDSLNSGRVEQVDKFKNQQILSICKVRSSEYWLSTHENGIYSLDAGVSHFRAIGLSGIDGTPLKVRFFKKGKDGTFWISSIGNGVYQLDATGKKLQHFSTQNGLIHNDIFAIYSDIKDRVWFGSQGAGLARLDPDQSWKLFSQQGIFPSRDVNDFAEDADGNIWIATDGQGLFRFGDDKFENVLKSSVQQANYPKGVVNTKQGLWLSYRKGIAFFNTNTNKNRALTSQDGLLDSETYASSIVKNTSGQLVFLNQKGITLYNGGSSISDILLIPKLTAIRLFFKTPIVATPSNTEILNGQFPSVKLAFDQNHLTFDFSAVDLSYSGKTYYRYRVKEIENEWAPPITQNSVTYTSLNPGQYNLLVQATNDLENWHEEIMEYSFQIDKPYWQQWWFYLSQVSAICLLFGATYYASRSDRTKLSLLRVMVFVCLFIVFEFLQGWIDPFASTFLGQTPVYRTLLNLVLAFLLLPVEGTIRYFFTGEKSTPLR
jgi:ligand-binding sensor domain-containing protein